MATPSYRAGSGSPLVLLHAGGTSWQLWTPVLERLTAGREVYAPTLPGHAGGPKLAVHNGHSIIQHLLEFLEADLDAAGLDRFDVVGNSIGGWLALELARSGRARRVVAIAPMGMQSAAEAPRIEQRMRLASRWLRLTRAGALPASRLPLARRFLLREASVRADRLPPALARELLSAYADCDVSGFFDAVNAYPALSAIQRPEEIEAPVLLIHGDRDWIATRAQMDRYVAALPNARLLELTGLGHCPQLDDPERIADEILRFLAPERTLPKGRWLMRSRRG